MHKSKLSTVVIDCQTNDLTDAARFWSAALGRKVDASEKPATNKYVKLGSGNEELMRVSAEGAAREPRSPRY
jgi:hypothetical protein